MSPECTLTQHVVISDKMSVILICKLAKGLKCLLNSTFIFALWGTGNANAVEECK